MKTLTVLIPKPGTRAAGVIDPGSGIVTDPVFDQIPARVPDNPYEGATVNWFDGTLKPEILVYYEGNRYGHENLRAYGDRVACAAGRLDQRYPTIARGLFRREDFTVVGHFTYADDWSSHELTFTNLEALATWLPLPD